MPNAAIKAQADTDEAFLFAVTRRAVPNKLTTSSQTNKSDSFLFAVTRRAVPNLHQEGADRASLVSIRCNARGSAELRIKGLSMPREIGFLFAVTRRAVPNGGRSGPGRRGSHHVSIRCNAKGSAEQLSTPTAARPLPFLFAVTRRAVPNGRQRSDRPSERLRPFLFAVTRRAVPNSCPPPRGATPAPRFYSL